ncbi:hypothetical protein HDU67_006657 [Dinochytrium kinnereticum]|nr:hypothetical protein HDU67_006657 [Dinochytrium kinnereticum]
MTAMTLSEEPVDTKVEIVEAAALSLSDVKLSAEVSDHVITEPLDFEADDIDASIKNMHRLNDIISEIGMGRYQWTMFFVCGVGWAADNMWLQALALVLPEVQSNFNITDNKTASLGTSMTLTGMIFGAACWGVISDVIGRRPAFLLTLAFGGVFGGVAAFSPNFVSYCCFLFLMGFGVGGNLPIDVTMYESPKYHIARGKVDEAIVTLRELARLNGKTESVTIDDNDFIRVIKEDDTGKKTAAEHLTLFWTYNLSPLFSKSLLRTTIIVWGIWMSVALAYNMFYSFLPKFIAGEGGSITVNETYRDYFLQALAGVPGSLAGYYLVESKMGRKGAMALSGLGVGAFIFCFTTTKNATWQLVFNCLASFLANLLYGVIYAYTPEVFETRNRGTAVGAASALNRITGAVAPFISGALLDMNFNIPLYVSAACFALVGVFSIFLPIETRGRAAL